MKKIKVAILAPYPAQMVLTADQVKPAYRNTSTHAAPWVRSLTTLLAKRDDIDFRVFTHSRAVSGVRHGEIDGVFYTFIPQYEPGRLNGYNLHFPARLQFRKYIKDYAPDLVHGFGTESAYGLIAVEQGLPSVVFIQGIVEKLAPYSSQPRLKLRLMTLMERYVIRNADGLIAETDFALQWARGLRSDVKIRAIPHACMEQFFLGQPDFKQKRIICIGSLSRIKGCTVVLDAFDFGMRQSPEIFNDSELIFVGGGPFEVALKNSTRKMGLGRQVRFVGVVPHDMIIKELEEAAMLVIGSRMDTSPNVVTEAHAAGLPVIGACAGGIPEMIKDGIDGFVVPVDDAESMSHSMGTLLSDLSRCAKMGQSGREKVADLNSAASIAAEHVRFYHEVLGRG